jgi:hypothetical protein
MKLYNKVKDSSEAVVLEEGGALYYGVDVDWIHNWRDFCTKGTKMPGRISNQELVNLI